MNNTYIPLLPKPPLNRMINNTVPNLCKKCGSSLHPKYNNFWIFFFTFGLNEFITDGCIHPECENYYKTRKTI